MGQQQCDEFGLLLQLHGVLALVGHQRTHVDGKVHLIRKARQQGQHQFVVVTWRDKIRRQPVALAEIVCLSKTIKQQRTYTFGTQIRTRAIAIQMDYSDSIHSLQ